MDDRETALRELGELVKELYQKRGGLVPGAVAKLQLKKRAQAKGGDFDENDLGYANFLAFAKEANVSVVTRPGSDFLLGPVGVVLPQDPPQTSAPRIRRDIWRAFIEFPVQGQTRFYDPERDTVGSQGVELPLHGIRIDPVPRDRQLEWRKEFAKQQTEGHRSDLLLALVGTQGIFTNFARALRDKPPLQKSWNHYVQNQVAEIIRHWANANNIAEDRWRAEAQVGTGLVPSTRAELYNLLDQVPIDELLKLQVPLNWLILTRRTAE